VTARTLEHQGQRARLVTWRPGESIAHLTPAAGGPLTADFVRSCLEWLRDRGFTSVVTSALTRPECDGFFAAGFDVHEELHLLSHDLRQGSAALHCSSLMPSASCRIRRARRGDRPDVLALDTVAFEPFWQLHDCGLDEALRATPRRRFRVVGPHREVLAYAITGVAAPTGYLQRLAVSPDARRRGLGRTLVSDSLRWASRRGATRPGISGRGR
jgi:ribosomal protein S18 acetylase RimI-like enzyme